MEISKFFQSFVQNKYLKAYDSIIQNAKDENRSRGEVYYELHHIIPKSFAPEISNLSKHPWNGVLLTPKEHFIVHRLLCKFTVGIQRIKSLAAYHAVCFYTRRATMHTPTSLQYRNARLAAILAGKEMVREQRVPKWSYCATMKEFEKLIRGMVDSGISDPQIGKHFGISAAAIYEWKRKLKIENRRALLRNKEWLFEQYVTNNRSSGDIANELSCTGTAVLQYLARFKIPTNQGNSIYHNSLLSDKEWLSEQLKNKSKQQIADIIGCTLPTVIAYVKRHGIAGI